MSINRRNFLKLAGLAGAGWIGNTAPIQGIEPGKSHPGGKLPHPFQPDLIGHRHKTVVGYVGLAAGEEAHIRHHHQRRRQQHRQDVHGADNAEEPAALVQKLSLFHWTSPLSISTMYPWALRPGMRTFTGRPTLMT